MGRATGRPITITVLVSGYMDCDQKSSGIHGESIFGSSFFRVSGFISPGSATVPGIAKPSAIELEINNKSVKGKIIRCTGDTCSFFIIQGK